MRARLRQWWETDIGFLTMLVGGAMLPPAGVAIFFALTR